MQTALKVRISAYPTKKFPHLIEFPDLEDVLRRQAGIVLQQVASRPLGAPAIGIMLRDAPPHPELRNIVLNLTLDRETRHVTLTKKLVFGGLRKVLDDLYGVKRIETGAEGRGSELALRVLPQGSIPADQGSPRPSIRMTPRRVMRSILSRRGQAEFRKALLGTYGRQCAITGCKIVDILEAAHVRPISEGGETAADNGLLLRADVHTLFDLDLLGIHPKSKKLVLAPAISKSEYAELGGKHLKTNTLDPAYLEERWLRFQANS
jgi:hypothetical protein